MRNGHGKSDGPVVPAKPPNKGEGARLPDIRRDPRPTPAEGAEGRGPAKGNPQEHNTLRAQDRTGVQQALARVRQAARKDKKLRVTTLLHHIYNPAMLREAYFGLKRNAAPGVDGQTWRQYGQALEANIQDLSARLKRGAYRAKPARRAYIPKPDGRQRLLGVTTLEDKLVQRATSEVLNAVYETDFLGFSYGFRPRRSQHNALDALYAGLLTRKVNWVLDADIRGFFDAINRDWLMKFVEHRIADQRVGRLIRKWLNAGVLEDGVRTYSDTGTVQGGSISPLLANIYLHYAFDQWVQQWRTKQARGDMIVVRYADDFIVGFQHQAEAERFMADLRLRFAKFGLELHPDKTRLIEFGRFAAENRRRRGQGKPETFDFLGFTHLCWTTRTNGRFTVLRQTMRKRLQAKLAEVKAGLKRRMHDPVPEVGKWLGMVVGGHSRYYGVPMNTPALGLFRHRVGWLWHRVLSRRSQRGRFTWKRMTRLVARYLPRIRVHHPYPLQRLGVIT
jgi:RNA-directed DNA polymerase